jgi:small subunit ribosomal protein S20
MPNAAAAKKAMRKSRILRERNIKIESNLKDLVKKSRRLIESKSKDAKELVAKTLIAFDKAAQKGVIKKNTRDRKKSRLQNRFNQAFK